MRTKRFLTVFPQLEPALLHKDVGAIPYFLAETCGWESSLAYFQKGRDGNQRIIDEKYANVVTMIPLGIAGNKILNAICIARFLVLRAREYDVINFYHDSVLFMSCALVYKMFNFQGKVHFKLDMSHLELETIINNKGKWLPSLRRVAKYCLSLSSVDLYTVETTRLYKTLAEDYYYRGRLHYCPNGFTLDGLLDADQLLRDKENIIMTVGRLGTYPKHTELLIDAATRIDKDILKGWKIYFVGAISSKEFLQYKDDALRKYPHLEDVFVFTGNITDRLKLYDLYRRSKIFCLTSRYESFGFVLLEAMYFGNFAVSSDLPASRDLTNDGALGRLFPIGDAKKLSELLAEAMSGSHDLNEMRWESHKQVVSKFNWQIIVKDLEEVLCR